MFHKNGDVIDAELNIENIKTYPEDCVCILYIE